MQHIIIRNLDRVQSSPITARYCKSFLCRLRGLTFQKGLPIDRGLLLVQSRESRVDSSIHMLGVSMELAIVWINDKQIVVDTRLARPWRLGYMPDKPARYVLEMAPERLADFNIGDTVAFEETDNEE